jgi:hypothetical protein
MYNNTEPATIWILTNPIINLNHFVEFNWQKKTRFRVVYLSYLSRVREVSLWDVEEDVDIELPDELVLGVSVDSILWILKYFKAMLNSYSYSCLLFKLVS